MGFLGLHDIWVSAGAVCGAPDGEYSKPPLYLDYYDKEFTALRGRDLAIVEVGVFRGQFLESLARYFPNASILGIEFQPERVKIESSNITLVQGDQGDQTGLERIFRRYTPEGFDIIIDDASHVAQLSKSLYDVAINWLKPGGSYYIEDWGTGYMSDWPDGASYRPPIFEGSTESGFSANLRSHDAGMVGFVKSLIDNVGAPQTVGTPSIASMALWYGVVKLVKR